MTAWFKISSSPHIGGKRKAWMLFQAPPLYSASPHLFHSSLHGSGYKPMLLAPSRPCLQVRIQVCLQKEAVIQKATPAFCGWMKGEQAGPRRTRKHETECWVSICNNVAKYAKYLANWTKESMALVTG